MGTGHGSASRGFPAAPLLSAENPGELVFGNAHLAKPGHGPRGTVLVRPPEASTSQLHNGLPFGAPAPSAAPHPFPEPDGVGRASEPRDEMRTTAPTNTLPPVAPAALPASAPGFEPAPPPRFDPVVASPSYDPPPRVESTPLPARSPLASAPELVAGFGAPGIDPAGAPPPATPFERASPPASFDPPPPARVESAPIVHAPEVHVPARPPPEVHELAVQAPAPHAPAVQAHPVQAHAVQAHPVQAHPVQAPAAQVAAVQAPAPVHPSAAPHLPVPHVHETPARAPRMTVPHTSQPDARGSLPSTPSNPAGLPFAPGAPDDTRDVDETRPAGSDASPWARERHVLPAVADPAAYAQSLPVPRVAPAPPRARTSVGLVVGVGIGMAFLVVAVITGIWWLGRGRASPDHPVAAPTDGRIHPATGEQPDGTATAHPDGDAPATARPIEIPIPTAAPRPHGSTPGSAEVEAPPPPPPDDKRFQPEGI